MKMQDKDKSRTLLRTAIQEGRKVRSGRRKAEYLSGMGSGKLH